MTKKKASSPLFLERLEARVALSGPGSILSMQAAQLEVQQVEQAYAAFASSYLTDLRTLLLARNSAGQINLAANRTAFDTQVMTDLNTLNTSLTNTLNSGPLPEPALSSMVQAQLTGSSPTSLASQLAALPTPMSLTRVRSFLARSETDVVRSEQRVVGELINAIRNSIQPNQQALRQAVQQIEQAYLHFGTSYLKDVHTVLLAPGPGGTVNLTANRTAFNTQVAQDLNMLSAQVTAAVQSLPSAASLVPTIQNELTGSAATSLETMLQAISTPNSMSQRDLRLFLASSERAVEQSFVTVVRQVAETAMM